MRCQYQARHRLHCLHARIKAYLCQGLQKCIKALLISRCPHPPPPGQGHPWGGSPLPPCHPKTLIPDPSIIHHKYHDSPVTAQG